MLSVFEVYQCFTFILRRKTSKIGFHAIFDMLEGDAIKETLTVLWWLAWWFFDTCKIKWDIFHIRLQAYQTEENIPTSIFFSDWKYVCIPLGIFSYS